MNRKFSIRRNHKKLLSLWLGLLISACTSYPVASQTTTGPILKAFWSKPGDVSSCPAGESHKAARTPRGQRKVTGTGNGRSGLIFAEAVGANVARALGRDDFDMGTFKTNMLQAAQGKVYTTLDYGIAYGRGDGSPVYVQSNLTRQVALFLALADEEELLSPTERALIVKWGNALASDQKREFGGKGAKSPDSRAAIAVAIMSWATVTQDSALFNNGRRKFMSVLPYIVKNIGNIKPYFGPSVRAKWGMSVYDEYNMVLTHIVEGAVILEANDDHVYLKSYKGKNLHDAVDWFANKINDPLLDFGGLSISRLNDHVGWIPIYISRFQGTKTDETLKAIIEKVRWQNNARNLHPLFDTDNLGGPTDCIWGMPKDFGSIANKTKYDRSEAGLRARFACFFDYAQKKRLKQGANCKRSRSVDSKPAWQ